MNPSKEYDKLYQEASEFLKKHNPCRREGGYCSGYPVTYSTVDGREYLELGIRKYVLCCAGCKHHSKKIGCRVKSILCKLWLCNSARGNLSLEQRQEWDEMKNRLHRILGYPGSRQSKLQYIKELNNVGLR